MTAKNMSVSLRRCSSHAQLGKDPVVDLELTGGFIHILPGLEITWDTPREAVKCCRMSRIPCLAWCHRKEIADERKIITMEENEYNKRIFCTVPPMEQVHQKHPQAEVLTYGLAPR